MEHYKILTQTLDEIGPFYNEVKLNSSIISGSNKYTLGIKYSPNTYNEMLADDKMYNIFIKKSVKQLLMSNFKFCSLISSQDEFKLEIKEIKFKKINISDLLEEESDESILKDIDYLKNILDSNQDEIKKVTFLLDKKYYLTLKSNGVVGVDPEILTSYENILKHLITFLSLGKIGVDL